ncbi:hypothetical protein MCOR27_004021 [Pyricularia oryzae]|nr:hypothetical protein MCOR27_004021 [Pyricularia oryzae]KAI6321532.1 hypothetical protein MCOR34_002545 [Pyricularia oryzae]KAI6371876.1 hypothetical protein MCOR32_006055 [Pyricularia oryzae]KAI6378541.1 hypothetical protein MCOR31_000529 [Pyricularia oryzae]KAI6400960.1 hypothetical protein MCOR23_004553 [Pyricularia oryzae]
MIDGRKKKITTTFPAHTDGSSRVCIYTQAPIPVVPSRNSQDRVTHDHFLSPEASATHIHCASTPYGR